MNIAARKADLKREIAEIGAFYEREYRIAVEPFQRELAELAALEPRPVYFFPHWPR